MLGDISHVENIYIRTGYTDMRKQLDGLIDIIQYSFRLDPYSNSLFLFCGKRADRIKAVHYDQFYVSAFRRVHSYKNSCRKA